LIATLLTFTAFALIVGFLWLVVLTLGPHLLTLFRATLTRLARLLARFGVDRFRERSPRVWKWIPVLLPLLIGGFVAGIAGENFLDLAELLHDKNPEMQAIDTRIHQHANGLRYDWLTHFFTFFTIIGTPVGLFVISLIAGGVLLRLKRYRWMLYLAVTGFGGGLLNLQLKSYFARARPSLAEALRQASGYSFPSGHAMGSFVVLGALGYLIARGVKSWRWRSLGLAVIAASILAIAASRIYLGVHWISDIGAGLAAGAVWLTATTTAYETLRRVRRVRGTVPELKIEN